MRYSNEWVVSVKFFIVVICLCPIPIDNTINEYFYVFNN